MGSRKTEIAPPAAGVVWGSALWPRAPQAEWGLNALIGRMAEIRGGARLTVAMRLVLEAQQRETPAAWIAGTEAFYPPDCAAGGVDLTALPVVHALEERAAARAADALLRSGGFGLVVADLAGDTGLPLAMQSRLAGLAKQWGAALVCLTPGRRETISLASLRAESWIVRRDFDAFGCVVRVTKDKRDAPGQREEEVRHGPGGLC